MSEPRRHFGPHEGIAILRRLFLPPCALHADRGSVPISPLADEHRPAHQPKHFYDCQGQLTEDGATGLRAGMNEDSLNLQC